jgi:hypothetical protein
MENYLERIKTQAENLCINTFPQKALELDDLINVWRILSKINSKNY